MNKSSSCGCLNNSSVIPHSDINELSEFKRKSYTDNEDDENTIVCSNYCEFFNSIFYCDNEDVNDNKDINNNQE